MSGRRALVAIAWALAATVAVSAAEDVRITPIVSDGRVLVSFAVRDAWTLGTREVLNSGLTLMFDYEVELRRPAAFWFFDPVLARVRVNALANYDTLTRGYKVTRLVAGRVARSERRDSEAEVRDWLTIVERVALDPISPLEPNAEYYVHVRLTTSPRRSVSLWPILPFGRDGISGRSATFPYLK